MNQSNRRDTTPHRRSGEERINDLVVRQQLPGTDNQYQQPDPAGSDVPPVTLHTLLCNPRKRLLACAGHNAAHSGTHDAAPRPLPASA